MGEFSAGEMLHGEFPTGKNFYWEGGFQEIFVTREGDLRLYLKNDYKLNEK